MTPQYVYPFFLNNYCAGIFPSYASTRILLIFFYLQNYYANLKNLDANPNFL